MIHHHVWYVLEELNDAIIPGRGQLIGFDVKRDFFNPLDLIPVIGPLSKLHKVGKLVKFAPKIKYVVIGGIGLAADVFVAKEAVEWYNERYRSPASVEESSSAARRGNAVGPGGGKKKRITYTGQSGRRTNGNAPPRCPREYYDTKRGYRVRCYLKRGHGGRHRYRNRQSHFKP